MNPRQLELLELIKKPTICMLAPSFPIDFEYPQIIGALKKLGFDKICELTFGARMVNYVYAERIKSHPDQKYYITSPCPTCVALIKSKYPELVQYLVPQVSPMAAMAKILKKHYPDHNVVFASPCLAKQAIEAPKYKDIINLVVTFKELAGVLEDQKIVVSDGEYQFDSFYEEATKVYPISGGLAQTANIKSFFKDTEICVADEPKNLFGIFDEIKSGKTQYRFFDILNCPGGCIGGPAIVNSKLSREEKEKRILDYRQLTEKEKTNNGNVELEKDIDFSASY
jgi:iron only hydrogenase large subunit-like protein